MKYTVIFVASQSLATFDNSVNDVIYTELLVKIYGKFSGPKKTVLDLMKSVFNKLNQTALQIICRKLLPRFVSFYLQYICD